MPDAIVLGAGAAGLATGLLLARQGWRVDIVERDLDDRPANLADVAGWRRPGATQTWHSHAFLARGRSLLAEHAPEVLDAVRAAGAMETRLDEHAPPTLSGPPPADGELVVIGCRRAVLDWALRVVVEREPGVTIHSGARVTGLLTGPAPTGLSGDPLLVHGVRLANGSSRAADLVIDAAGRLSPVRRWLAAAGAELPPQAEVDCGIAYYSRFYRRRGPAPDVPLNRGHTAGASFDRYSCLMFPADGDIFSMTFGVLPEDTAIRVLRHGDAFDAAARSIAMFDPWLDPEQVEPVSPVTAMSHLTNRLRPLVSDGRPAVLGLLQVGDAAVITNPAHTRGVTLAVLGAVRLAEAVGAVRDPAGWAHALDESLRAEFAPWFEDSCAQDAARLLRWRPAAAGTPRAPGTLPAQGAPPTGFTPWPAAPVAGVAAEVGAGAGAPGAPADGVTNGEAYLAARRDPWVWDRFTRLQNALLPPSAVLTEPEFVARVRAVLAAGWRPAPIPGPSHGDLVGLASAALADRPLPPERR
ncbi:2-polyprenyl-6-methoxyphenol hydroxylase-like oxidoreductase [Frankia sp. EI5c]|uniref:FAD-dependent oxidoreductase n=1 Tax=Frankia sp. EI5c TaxID=683316 RepID=UPI0007C2DCC9|nr:FAD-dependent oxidoreductase [Frankia sp. EI5c]OAA26662.1 2-polyprenyl-6-methoxyphenol hydroxylase-like oxidoreductase [Frankia sp. EI5c]